jgi:hypothetical protein
VICQEVKSRIRSQNFAFFWFVEYTRGDLDFYEHLCLEKKNNKSH